MEKLRRDFAWVEEKFKKGEIKLNLEHGSYTKRLFEGNDIERKVDYFLDLFMGDLFLSQLTEVKEFRGLGQECRTCGEYIVYKYNVETGELLDYVRNQDTDKLERGKCTVVEEYTFEVSFPTGKIICDDRLPNSYDMLQILDDKTKYTLNSDVGLKERTLSYASANILHCYVGNTCPSVFKKGDTLVIGHASSNECEDCRCGVEDCDCDYQEYPPVEGAENIAYICTDLWWASIVDVSVYEKLLIDYFGEEQGKAHMNEITPAEREIKPGVYECTYHMLDEMHDYPNVYATFKWVRDI